MHTPGPWKTEQNSDDPDDIDIDGAEIAIGVCKVYGYGPSHREESLGNANLIAAAPDMFDALMLFIELFDEPESEFASPNPLCTPAAWTAYKAANAAIAKATGKL